jgi:adenine-specific DNA-methyltransferase
MCQMIFSLRKIIEWPQYLAKLSLRSNYSGLKNDNWLNYGSWLAAPRNSQNFVGAKLLIRKIVADTLIATYVHETSYCNTLLHVLKLHETDSLTYLFLLGILNSHFIGWYFRKKFQISADDTFPQIMIGDIQQLPIPDVTPEKQAPIVALVEQILAAKKSPPVPLSEVGSENQTNIPALEAEIDRLVYALYGLTDEEIAVVEGKR